MSKKSLDNLINDINKKFGYENAKKNVASMDSDEEEVIIPCSPPILRYVLGSKYPGWVEGKLHEFFGKEAAGKTTLLFQALKDCYDFYGGDKKVAILDIEHRLNKDWAATLGLDVENLLILRPPHAEAATDIMKTLIESQEFCAIGFDSVGAASPAKEHNSFEDAKDVMGGVAKVMRRHVDTIAPLANMLGVTCFYVNQLRADMEGYRRPITPGGHAFKHRMSRRIYVRPGKDKYEIKAPDGKPVQVGYPVFFKAVKNSFGGPGREGSADFYWEPSDQWLDHIGYDFDDNYSRLGLVLGVIEQSGPWYAFGDIKERGRDNFFKKLESEGMKDVLFKEVEQKMANANIGTSRIVTDTSQPDGPEIEDAEV